MEKTNQEPIKILALESDNFFRMFLRDTLCLFSEQEFDVSILENVEDFFNALSKSMPDVIVLCLSASEKRGEKIDLLAGNRVLKKIKSEERLRKIPVVIFSQYKEKGFYKKAMALGAAKYIVKGECVPKDIIEILSHPEKIEKPKTFFRNILLWRNK